MRKDKVVLDFVKLHVAEKPEFGANVMLKMTDNPNFPSPDVSLEVLKAKNDLVRSCSVETFSRSKEATILLHQAIADWNDTMRIMANYVNRIADGDGAVILSAGFNLVKQPAAGPRPELKVVPGEKSGTVALRRQAVAGARAYIWQLCTGSSPAEESGWTVAQVTSKASVVLTGLTTFTKYWFRVAAVTVGGTTAYSQPVMQVVV
jgi:hypothetical protein